MNFHRMPKGKKPAVDSSDGDEDQAPNNMNAQSMFFT